MATFARLADLSTFLAPGWFTRGRVIRLDNCRAYENNKGRGFVFTFAVADDKHRMECVAFGEHAQQLVKMLTLNSVFNFHDVRLTKKKENYASADAPFQLIIQDYKKIISASSEEADTCSINEDIDVELTNFDALTTAIDERLKIDLLGILVGCEEPIMITSRSTAEKTCKGGLILENELGQQVSITLWHEQARRATTLPLYQPLLVLDLRGEIQSGGEIALTSRNSTTFHSAAECDEGKSLLEAYSLEEQPAEKKLLTLPFSLEPSLNNPLKLVSAIALAVRQQVETEYFRLIAIVTRLPYPPNFYLRCPTTKCGAKVQRTLLGRYDCTKCQATTQTPSVGLTLELEIQDYSGSAMITVFNESAGTFVDQTLLAAKTLHDENPEGFLQRLDARRFLEFDFRVSVSRNANGIFSGRCWSLRTINESTWHRLLEEMQKDNERCIIPNSCISPASSTFNMH